MENIIKLNINKTAKTETDICILMRWTQYVIATSAVQLITHCCGHSFQHPILIFVVTLYNDLAAREGQLGSALTVLSLDWSGVE